MFVCVCVCVIVVIYKQVEFASFIPNTTHDNVKLVRFEFVGTVGRFLRVMKKHSII